MILNKKGVTPGDFHFLKGQDFFDANTIQQIEFLSSEEHHSVDNAGIPFWATKVQDLLEQKAVSYSEREIQEEQFLGMKIIHEEDAVRVSVGEVGTSSSIAQVVISLKKDGENSTKLDIVDRIEWGEGVLK